MKIQKTLLYGLAIVGGIIAIMYLTKGMRKGNAMASGGSVPPPAPPAPPVGGSVSPMPNVVTPIV